MRQDIETLIIFCFWINTHLWFKLPINMTNFSLFGAPYLRPRGVCKMYCWNLNSCFSLNVAIVTEHQSMDAQDLICPITLELFYRTLVVFNMFKVYIVQFQKWRSRYETKRKESTSSFRTPPPPPTRHPPKKQHLMTLLCHAGHKPYFTWRIQSYID